MNKKIKWTAVIVLVMSSPIATAISFIEAIDSPCKHVSKVDSKTQSLMVEASALKNSADEAKVQPLSTPALTTKPKATPLARVLAQSDTGLAEKPFMEDRTLNLEISELRDSSGLVYLGGKVSAAELSGYLAQLKAELGEEQYAIYRQHQAARDHQSFHVTLVNPYEYQTINKDKLKSLTQFRVVLHGLGRVEKDEKKSYFVVASSADGKYIRQNLLLNHKDFHVTLGFYPDDIYGVSKGQDTLITQ